VTSHVFTFEGAEAVLAEIRPDLDEVVRLRGELTVAVHAHQEGDESVPLADLKGMEARLAELLDAVRARGVEVKGWAPLLLDFPAVRDGMDVLLCWLEGEANIAWYHDPSHGFAGRLPL